MVRTCRLATRFRAAHARLTEGELKNNGHAADQIIKRILISVVGGLLHQSYKRSAREKPCLKKPLDAPPSAAWLDS